MATTLLKPRWEAWENICIQKAFAQKIQHKIMATALGRTVPSVSKKIKNLGLRVPSTTRGRTKGKRESLSRMEKIPQDLSNMIKILETYAPLQYYQKGHIALKKGCWSKSQLLKCSDKNERTSVCQIEINNSPFSFIKPLDFILSKNPITNKTTIKKIPGEATYVSLYYIDQWAGAEGFHRTSGVLRHKGISYWKDGIYFSQTQLLMHLNRLRLEHHLNPLALIDEEGESPVDTYP